MTLVTGLSAFAADEKIECYAHPEYVTAYLNVLPHGIFEGNAIDNYQHAKLDNCTTTYDNNNYVLTSITCSSSWSVTDRPMKLVITREADGRYKGLIDRGMSDTKQIIGCTVHR